MGNVIGELYMETEKTPETPETPESKSNEEISKPTKYNEQIPEGKYKQR